MGAALRKPADGGVATPLHEEPPDLGPSGSNARSTMGPAAAPMQIDAPADSTSADGGAAIPLHEEPPDPGPPGSNAHSTMGPAAAPMQIDAPADSRPADGGAATPLHEEPPDPGPPSSNAHSTMGPAAAPMQQGKQQDPVLKRSAAVMNSGLSPGGGGTMFWSGLTGKALDAVSASQAQLALAAAAAVAAAGHAPIEAPAAAAGNPAGVRPSALAGACGNPEPPQAASPSMEASSVAAALQLLLAADGGVGSGGAGAPAAAGSAAAEAARKAFQEVADKLAHSPTQQPASALGLSRKAARAAIARAARAKQIEYNRRQQEIADAHWQEQLLQQQRQGTAGEAAAAADDAAADATGRDQQQQQQQQQQWQGSQEAWDSQLGSQAMQGLFGSQDVQGLFGGSGGGIGCLGQGGCQAQQVITCAARPGWEVVLYWQTKFSMFLTGCLSSVLVLEHVYLLDHAICTSSAPTRAPLLMPILRLTKTTKRKCLPLSTSTESPSGHEKYEVHVQGSSDLQTLQNNWFFTLEHYYYFCLLRDAPLQKLPTCSLRRTLPLVEGPTAVAATAHTPCGLLSVPFWNPHPDDKLIELCQSNIHPSLVTTGWQPKPRPSPWEIEL